MYKYKYSEAKNGILKPNKMTEEQTKAREIVIKYQFQNPPLMFDVAKNCALIGVNEIIAVFYFINPNSEDLILCEELNNWKKIREEITNL